MIIDKILDRKDGQKYNAKQFYNDITLYGDVGYEIAEALDNGEENDVKKELCKYIIKNEYNPAICDYIESVKWL
jgi:hypothetical protein